MTKRVFMIGATGTIGRATVRQLVAQGYDVVCFLRNRQAAANPALTGATLRFGDVCDPSSLMQDGFCGEHFDVIVSTLASRTGRPRDAWEVDHGAHSLVLKAACDGGVRQMILLSAICVQKPKLAFQHAKLAFEDELIRSGLIYSIVRPTAFFKSLSGQVSRVKAGKPYLIFGDGRLNACKPISDNDLAAYLASCLDDESKWNRVLPIGGPGKALTPREQGEMIFAALGRKPYFRSVPIGLLKAIRALLFGAGLFNRSLADKAELAGIGLYYATESMLLLNPETGDYDADATPSTGRDTLQAYYDQLIQHNMPDDRGDHAVF